MQGAGITLASRATKVFLCWHSVCCDNHPMNSSTPHRKTSTKISPSDAIEAALGECAQMSATELEAKTGLRRKSVLAAASQLRQSSTKRGRVIHISGWRQADGGQEVALFSLGDKPDADKPRSRAAIEAELMAKIPPVRAIHWHGRPIPSSIFAAGDLALYSQRRAQARAEARAKARPRQ